MRLWHVGRRSRPRCLPSAAPPLPASGQHRSALPPPRLHSHNCCSTRLGGGERVQVLNVQRVPADVAGDVQVGGGAVGDEAVHLRRGGGCERWAHQRPTGQCGASASPPRRTLPAFLEWTANLRGVVLWALGLVGRGESAEAIAVGCWLGSRGGVLWGWVAGDCSQRFHGDGVRVKGEGDSSGDRLYLAAGPARSMAGGCIFRHLRSRGVNQGRSCCPHTHQRHTLNSASRHPPFMPPLCVQCRAAAVAVVVADLLKLPASPLPLPPSPLAPAGMSTTR